MVKKVKKKTPAKSPTKTVKKKGLKKTVAKKSARKKAVKKAASKKSAKVKKTSKKKKVAASKKSPVKSSRKKIRRTTRSILKARELAHFRELLVEKLKEIIGDVNHIESGALKTSRLDSSGDLSSMPIHMADLGSDNYEQEFALGLMDSERKIVQEIYAALERIDRKTYGICEGTGEPIPKMRLEGIPWTRYCVKYAEMLENGLVQEKTPYEYDEDDESNDDWQDDDRDMDEYFFSGYDGDIGEDEEE